MIKKIARVIMIISMVSTCLSGISTPFSKGIGVNAEELGEFRNLGPQITSVTTHAGGFGKDHNGRDVAYTGLVGDPSKLVVIDIETETIVDEAYLPGATGVRGIAVASDGSAYAGTHTGGQVFKYTPGVTTSAAIDLGRAVGITHIYELKPGNNGEVYGATYMNNAANESKVFKYDPINGYTDFGTMKKGQKYAMTVEPDVANNVLYVGGGAVPFLVKYNMTTGEKKEFTFPAEHISGIKYIEELNLIDNKLFAKLNPGSKTLVYDTETEQVIDVIDKVGSRVVSQKSPIDNKVYYTTGYVLHSYDLTTLESTSLDINVGGDGLNFGFVQLNEEGFSGHTLVGVLKRGLMFKYNLETGKVKLINPKIKGEPIQIHTVTNGPDGKIYNGGYLSGEIGYFDPITEDYDQYAGVGQPEKMGVMGSKIYIGRYPEARIYEYDPTLPWVTNVNPKELFRLNGENQNRPMAMVPVEKENKLFIGTVPLKGVVGAFTVYDFETKNVDVYSDIVKDQSVVSLAYKDGEVFGGTTIWGDLGSDAVETEAKLFVWDVAKKEKVLEIVPVKGKKGITDLIVGPDGNIWGMAEGTLFIFDPKTRQVVYSEEKFTTTSYEKHVWRDAFLHIGTDGNVYGTVQGKFFWIDAATKKVTVLREIGATRLSQDNHGNFYFAEVGDLWKYTGANDSKLSELKVDGEKVVGFKRDKLDYDVILPYGTTESPSVEPVVSSSKATVATVNASKLPGITTVTVKSESGITSTYNINFNWTEDTRLSELKINGQVVEGFAKDQFEYNVTLPYGTTQTPSITATSSNAKATVATVDASALPGTSTVTVKAEDGTSCIYKIKFVLETRKVSTKINDQTVTISLSDSAVSDDNVTVFIYSKGSKEGDEPKYKGQGTLKDGTISFSTTLEEGTYYGYIVSDISGKRTNIDEFEIDIIDECFIATAAYGSKFQPAVTLLRSFRDQYLLTNKVGASFVRFYYKNSPSIANFIAENSLLKTIVKILLTPFVAAVYMLYHPIVFVISLILSSALILIKKKYIKLQINNR